MAASARLHHHMVEMVKLEANTCETLDQLSKQAVEHAENSALLDSFREISRAQKQSLQKRLGSILTGTVFGYI